MPQKLIDRLEPRRLLAILYVDLNSPIGTNDGSSWGNAFFDLHEALAAANSGDTIRIADGTYKPTTGTDRTIAFQLKSGVGLYGGYAGHGAINPDARDFINTPTILSGEIGSSASDDNSHNVFKGNELAELVTIDGFMVTQTQGEEYPLRGAIYVNNSNLTVRNLTGISNKNSCVRFESDSDHYPKLQVYDSNFSLNTSGVSVDCKFLHDPRVLMENCSFTQNTGAGLWVSDSFYINTGSAGPDGFGAIVRSSHFDGNGFGAYFYAGAVVMDCTFNNNAAHGLYFYRGLVTNSELNDNGLTGVSAEKSLTVINSELCRNGTNAAY